MLLDGIVQDGYKSELGIVLTEEEEHLLAYLVQKMVFGLSCDAGMEMAFTIVDKAQRKYPFKDGKAGRDL